MYGSNGPRGSSGGPGCGSKASSTTTLCPLKAPLPPPGGGGGLLFWDNYKGSPVLELWTASTRNLGEPQVPD